MAGKGGKTPGAGRKKGSRDKFQKAEAKKAIGDGLTPLQFLLGIMNDESADKRDRADAAKAAAPYCHPRLQSTQLDAKAKVTHLVEFPNDDGVKDV